MLNQWSVLTYISTSWNMSKALKRWKTVSKRNGEWENEIDQRLCKDQNLRKRVEIAFMHVKKGFANEKRFQMLFVNNLIQLVIAKSFHTVMSFYRYNPDIKEMRSIHKNWFDTISFYQFWIQYFLLICDHSHVLHIHYISETVIANYNWEK